jgi:hypothetical protein
MLLYFISHFNFKNFISVFKSENEIKNQKTSFIYVKNVIQLSKMYSICLISEIKI